MIAITSDPSELDPVLSIDWDAVEGGVEREIGDGRRHDDSRMRSNVHPNGVGEKS